MKTILYTKFIEIKQSYNSWKRHSMSWIREKIMDGRWVTYKTMDEDGLSKRLWTIYLLFIKHNNGESDLKLLENGLHIKLWIEIGYI